MKDIRDRIAYYSDNHAMKWLHDAEQRSCSHRPIYEEGSRSIHCAVCGKTLKQRLRVSGHALSSWLLQLKEAKNS